LHHFVHLDHRLAHPLDSLRLLLRRCRDLGDQLSDLAGYFNKKGQACNVLIKGRHLSWKNFMPAEIAD
jgi:hypothetical protein